MTTEFWVGGHQETPIKLDIDINEETSQYITALPDKIIVVIKYGKTGSIYTKMTRFIIDKNNNVTKQNYVTPNLPTVIEGDWNSYLARYTVTLSTDKCVRAYDDYNTSFFNNRIYDASLAGYETLLRTQNKDDLDIHIRETALNNQGNCVITANNIVKTKIYKLLDEPLKQGQTMDILGISPLPISILHVGGDREPEEVKITEQYYPTDKIYFYAKSAAEYYILLKSNNRLLGIKRYKEGTTIKFVTSLVTNPALLSDYYKIWLSIIANTWSSPNLSNYKLCANQLLVNPTTGYDNNPFFSVKETKDSNNIIDFVESLAIDINKEIEYKNTDNVTVKTKLRDLLLDENNSYKYPSSVVTALLEHIKYTSTEEECSKIILPVKKAKLKKLVTDKIKANQINILAASPITTTSTVTVRGGSPNSVKIKAKKLSNQ